MKRLALLLLALAGALLLHSSPAAAHPAPYSYLDLTLEPQRIEGRLTVHATDVARDLAIADPAILFDQQQLDERRDAIAGVVLPHLSLRGEGDQPIALRLTGITPSPTDADAIVLALEADTTVPAVLAIDTALFASDPAHHTFVNVYEGGTIRQQFLFDAESAPQRHYAGSTAGVMAVIGTFLPSGVHHVLIGPDHVLFMVGLILMGGSLRRLVLIVTAFTLGHSVTLALSALSIFSPPAWLIEPLIALSIIVVGVDNLMRGNGRDLRALFALAFGLIHGFGFAFVLQEFGLPRANLAWALLAFNLGVEIGQLLIVVPLALALAAVRRRSAAVAKRIGIGGSLAVIAAGAYWFVDRVRNLGSG